MMDVDDRYFWEKAVELCKGRDLSLNDERTNKQIVEESSSFSSGELPKKRGRKPKFSGIVKNGGFRKKKRGRKKQSQVVLEKRIKVGKKDEKYKDLKPVSEEFTNDEDSFFSEMKVSSVSSGFSSTVRRRGRPPGSRNKPKKNESTKCDSLTKDSSNCDHVNLVDNRSTVSDEYQEYKVGLYSKILKDLTVSDDEQKYIWCMKCGYWIYVNTCAYRVGSSCRKCVFYKRGMELHKRYKLNKIRKVVNNGEKDDEKGESVI